MALPPAFCWTKFGTEAGEQAGAILRRKDAERARDDGVFLWGIGSSIRPSVLALLNEVSRPEVLFSPMLASPSDLDVSPSGLLVWTSARGIDGLPYLMPPNAVVTSRAVRGRRVPRHYALVCRRDTSLVESQTTEWLDAAELRNLRTHNPVGSSQVTSVVRRDVDGPATRGRYRLAFRAELIAPYLLDLAQPLVAVASVVRQAMTLGARESVISHISSVTSNTYLMGRDLDLFTA